MIFASLVISFSAAVLGVVLDKGIVFVSYGIIIPLTLLLPRFFYHLDGRIKNTVSYNWVKKLDFFAFFIILFNAPASVYLHDLNFQYDRFLHFSVPFFAIIVFFLLWLPVVKIKKEIKKKRFLAFVFFTLFISLFLWEGTQYAIDQTFKTKLFFDASQDISVDASEDVFFGFLGISVGLVYLIYNFDKIVLSVWTPLEISKQ